METKRHLNIPGLLTLALYASVSQAGLIDLSERNYLSGGDGLITYDATTGLEWLDLTYTVGNSILDTEADAEIWANGWQWATTEQTNALLDHTVLPQGRSTNHPDNLAFIALLGATYERIEPNQYTSKFAAGISRGHYFPAYYSIPAGYKPAFVDGHIYHAENTGPVGCDDEPVCVSRAGDEQDTWSESDSLPTFGSWLVRNAAMPDHPIPEPSILLIWATGLACLGFVRLKNQT
ncbi:MAG: hypothetical protein KZQ76_12670 [Candidatus Thiodiazotropha sp. (ex Epidulcina cf. delphinae)]|nr:hypothetical protein [Candidatus Thiodiazotropha sp. (ex Epidulcina cf. delphinae)]